MSSRLPHVSPRLMVKLMFPNTAQSQVRLCRLIVSAHLQLCLRAEQGFELKIVDVNCGPELPEHFAPRFAASRSRRQPLLADRDVLGSLPPQVPLWIRGTGPYVSCRSPRVFDAKSKFSALLPTCWTCQVYRPT